MFRMYRAIALFAVFGCAAFNAHAQELLFEKDIYPIFAKACAGCHFPTVERLKGKLDVSSVASMIAGGETGPAIVPGNADDSYLVALIEHREEPVMPPERNGKKLSGDQLALIRAWIDQGAKTSGEPIPLAEAEPEAPADAPAAEPAAPAALSAAAFAPEPHANRLALGTLHDVMLYTVSEDGKSLTLDATLEGHAEMVRALAFSPDGSILAAAGGKPGRSGEIQLWNVTNRTLLRTIAGHDDNILDIAFSPDGKRIASASYDKTIGVWDVESGEQVHALKHHVDAVYSVAFSPDGTRIASGAGDRTVKVWDAETGAMLMTLSDSLEAVYAVAFAPNGKHLAGAGADKMIRVWHLGTSGVIDQSSLSGGVMVGSTFAHNEAVLDLIYAPGGNTLFSSSEDKRIKIWDADSLTEKTEIEAQPDWVTALALNAGGTLVAAGRYDSTGAVYAADTGTLLAAREPDSDFMVAANEPSGALKEGKVNALDVGAVLVRATVPPSLQSVGPDRWHRGADVEVTIQGKNLDGAEPVASHPGITPAIVEVIPGEEPNLEELAKRPRGTGANIIDNARPYTIKMKLAIAEDVPPGSHQLMFRTPTGITNPVGFTVILQPDVGETEPNNTLEDAPAVEWPNVFIGQIDPSGDVDRYRIAAKAGDEIVASVTDSALNTSLKVTGLDGNVLADSRDFGSGNNTLGYRVAADGEYVIELADNELRAGLGYRLHVGRFPMVTDHWPLGVRAGDKQTVNVEGFNLPGESLEVQPAADAAFGTRAGLPIPGVPGSPVSLPSVVTGPYEEGDEQEGNDAPAEAQPIGVPFTVNGRIQSNGESAVDRDHYRFTAKEGQPIFIEAMASRLGSPLDSVVEVLDASGELLQRAVVRCVAKTHLVLSGRDSRSGGMRFDSWTDFRVNDYVMVGGEILRLSRIPDYPDEDVNFATYPNGQRMGLFGTTPEHHPVDAKAYRVEIHPPGAQFPPNGMPVYPIYWRNDDGFFDDGESTGDSLIEFTAPADGEYIVRIQDVAGRGGEDFAYRLTLRPPNPDFEFFPGPYRVNIAPGSRFPLDVRVRRDDGFDGAVHVAVHDLPDGFSVAPDVILPGEERVKLALVAAPDAKSTELTDTFRVTAEATIDGETIAKESRIGAITVSAKQPDVVVNNGEQAITIKPGESGYISVKLDRNNGFTSRSPIDVLNLPFGVRVMDTGLNGILVREGETERRMELYVEPWVEPMTRNIYIQSTIETPSSGNPVFIGEAIALTVSDEAPAQVAANPDGGEGT